MNERNKVKCSSSSNERPATSVTTTNLDIQTIIMRWCRQAFVIFSYPIHCSVVSQLFAYEIGLDLIKLLAFERGWAIGFCLRFVSWGLIGCCVWWISDVQCRAKPHKLAPFHSNFVSANAWALDGKNVSHSSWRLLAPSSSPPHLNRNFVIA